MWEKKPGKVVKAILAEFEKFYHEFFGCDIFLVRVFSSEKSFQQNHLIIFTLAFWGRNIGFLCHNILTILLATRIYPLHTFHSSRTALQFLKFNLKLSTLQRQCFDVWCSPFRWSWPPFFQVPNLTMRASTSRKKKNHPWF